MFRLIWILSVWLHDLLHRFAPTNILINAIRTQRRRLKWGVPAMLLGRRTSVLPTSAPGSSVTVGQAGSTCWSCCSSGMR